MGLDISRFDTRQIDPSELPPNISRPQTALVARGLIAEPFQVGLVADNRAIPTQRVEGSLIGLSAGDIVSQIVVILAVAAAGTVPTAIKLGLLDSNGNTVAATANVASDAKWTGALQPIGFSLVTPFVVARTDGYYAAIYQNGVFGTTPFQIGRVGSGTLAAAVTAFGSGPRPYIEATGIADLTGAIALANAGSGNACWIAAA